MFERDYILRMFSMLGKALARIIFFRETKSYDAALLEIDNTGRSLLGLDTSTIERLPSAGLRNVLGTDPPLLQSRLYTAGVLLKEKAEILELKEEDVDSAPMYLKALRLMIEELPGIEDVDGKKAVPNIDSLVERLDEYELPRELNRKLIDYFIQTGRFDKAEDLIFDAVEEEPSFVDEAISIYDKLLLESDGVLDNGHLPRNEVEDALRDLREKRQKVSGT